MNQLGYFTNSKLNQVLSDVKLVIFDMNGLIVNDEPIQLLSLNQALEEYDGIEIGESYWKEHCVGHPQEENIRRILGNNHIRFTGGDVRSIRRDWEQNYLTNIRGHVQDYVRPGAIELINYVAESEDHELALVSSATSTLVDIVLGKEGLNIGIASLLNNPERRVGKIYRRLGLWKKRNRIYYILFGLCQNFFEKAVERIYNKNKKFDYIVSNEPYEVAVEKVSLYRRLLDETKILPSKCVVFEDTEEGVNSAAEAKIGYIIAVPNDYTKNQNFNKATCRVNSLERDAKVE